MHTKITLGCMACFALIGPVWAVERVETFESAAFSNHTVVTESRSTDFLTVSVELGGKNNMKEVVEPAALFIGFDPSDPVREVSIKPVVAGQVFTPTRLKMSNQFDMTEKIRIRAFRAGDLVGEFSAEVPWPMADVLMPSDSSFELIDEMRLSASDMYFYLEDIAFRADQDFGSNQDVGSNQLDAAQPIPVFRSWSVFVLAGLMWLMLVWRRHHQVA